jgi:hypothetical protein
MAAAGKPTIHLGTLQPAGLAAAGTTQARLVTPFSGEVVAATIYFDSVQATTGPAMSAELINVTQSCKMTTTCLSAGYSSTAVTKQHTSFVFSTGSCANVAAGDVIELKVVGAGSGNCVISGVVAQVWLDPSLRKI